MDLDLEEALDTETTVALALTRMRFKVPHVDRSSLAARVTDVKSFIEISTSEAAILGCVPQDFKSEVRDFLKRYRDQVEGLASCRSFHRRLQKHKANRSYPNVLNSLKVPAIQFSRPFLDAPMEDMARGVYDNPRGGRGSFEQVTESAVRLLKDQTLERWIKEKGRELEFLSQKASAADAVIQLEGAIEQCLAEISVRWDYLKGKPCYGELVSQVQFAGACMFIVASTIVAKVNQLVLTEEDRKLMADLKKMDIDKPIVKDTAKAAPNELSELKKMVANLSKKVSSGMQGQPAGKKVCLFLQSLLLNIAVLLVLTPHSLKTLLLDAIWDKWEEGPGKRQGEEESRRREEEGHCQKQARRQGESRVGCKSKGKGREAQRWQKEWQEVVMCLVFSNQVD